MKTVAVIPVGSLRLAKNGFEFLKGLDLNGKIELS